MEAPEKVEIMDGGGKFKFSVPVEFCMLQPF